MTEKDAESGSIKNAPCSPPQPSEDKGSGWGGDSGVYLCHPLTGEVVLPTCVAVFVHGTV